MKPVQLHSYVTFLVLKQEQNNGRLDGFKVGIGQVDVVTEGHPVRNRNFSCSNDMEVWTSDQERRVTKR